MRDLEGGIDALAVGDIVFGRLEDGRHIALPLDRAGAMLETLVELFDPRTCPRTGRSTSRWARPWRWPRSRRLTRLRWLGAERLRALAEELRGLGGQAIAPPPGLRATLRHYQQQGLDWLQFLRGFDLGGILADDMGLGKTVQTLAHILAEKRAGRLDRPCLVVCPTSLVPNWRPRRRASRRTCGCCRCTAPTAHAPLRRDRRHDLVLTTYALLPRDTERCCRCLALVVLDEAQAIKNPAAKATHAVCQLKAGTACA